MGYNTFNNPYTQDFINRKIRPDGFSTFRRGNAPVLSQKDRYALAIINEGKQLGITPKGIQIALATTLVETNLTMYANSNVPESLNFPHDAVGSDHDSTGLFQQRQAWGPLSSTMDPTRSANLFYRGGQGGQRGLTAFDYNSDSRTPGGWAQAVQVSAFPDRYDGRFGEAQEIYSRLANATDQGDDMAQVPQEQWDRVYQELTRLFVSRSPFRPFNDAPQDTMAGFTLYADGNSHWPAVKAAAELGHPASLQLLQYIAAGDPNRYPDRSDDIKLAQAILADIDSKDSEPTPQPSKVASVAPQIVYQPAPQPAATPAVKGSDTGQAIGDLYNVLERLKLADALPIEGRAPLAALIAVLQTKNGSQIS